MPDILTHSDHNRLQAEYFGEAAVRWYHMGFDFMARHYAATAAHCARLAIEGTAVRPDDLGAFVYQVVKSMRELGCYLAGRGALNDHGPFLRENPGGQETQNELSNRMQRVQSNLLGSRDA